MKLRPFLGVDGEGAGRDDRGRQLYQLLCAGERYITAKPLSTEECLEFILSLPENPILVGYYFNYDVTMILRDLPRDKMEHLCKAPSNYGGNSPYTWFHDYGIEWQPGFLFRVCRLDTKNKPKRHTSRTIYDVSGHFRMPFLEALQLYRVGDAADLAKIAAGKERRGAVMLVPDDLEYCRLECDLLTELMERLREACIDADCLPRRWDGAAKITSALLSANGIPKAVKPPTRRDVSRETHHYGQGAGWQKAVAQAQFGGRVECRAIGDIPGPIWLYDLGSAYPAALLTLPCPVHTEWHRFKGEPRGWRWWLGVGRYRDTANAPRWGALPVRRADQSTLYPLSAEGAWWSPELQGLQGFDYRGGWGADRECDCHPWDWVRDAYARRMALGPEIGYPLKIALAAINGKLSQRRGIMAPYRDIPASGLLMSWVRRRLRDALALAHDDGIMAMTDAVASTRRLTELHCGEGLGEWRESRLERLHVVGNGIYWSENDVRARSIGRSKIAAVAPEAEAAWHEWLAGGLAPIGRPPEVNVPLDVFIGPRTAIQMAWQLEPGTWRRFEFPLSYDWRAKRQAARIEGGCLITEPRHDHVKSHAYNPEHLTETEKLMQLMEASDA